MRSALALLAASSLLTLGCVAPDSAPQSTADRVVDGVPTADAVPWQARLLVRGETTCSGALIAPYWVLTAGHCVAGEPPTDIELVLGDRRISEVNSSEQWRTVASIQLFPGWGSDSGVLIDDDIALVELGEPAHVGADVEPIRLADEGTLACAATVSGWGSPSYTEGTSDALLSAVLAFAPDARCNQHLETLGEAKLSDRIICAGGATGAPGACHGDSGAPFVTGADGPRLVGISVSGGLHCDELSLFAKVSKYSAWVASIAGI